MPNHISPKLLFVRELISIAASHNISLSNDDIKQSLVAFERECTLKGTPNDATIKAAAQKCMRMQRGNE